MKCFIEEYYRLQQQAELYLHGIYSLQEEFDITLELGDIERSYHVESLVVFDNKLYIQVYKSGYDWGGISDNLIELPDNIDVKLQELHSYCLEKVRQEELEREQRAAEYRLEKEENERAEYERLQAKYGAK